MRVTGLQRTLLCVAGGVVCLSIIVAGTTYADGSEPDPDRRIAGRVPEAAFQEDGTVNMQLVPDLVETFDRDGNVVGFVSKADVFPSLSETQPPPSTDGLVPNPLDPPTTPPADRVIPVYSLQDRTTIVGHMYPGRGFVPLGTDPATVLPFSVTTGQVISTPGP